MVNKEISNAVIRLATFNDARAIAALLKDSFAKYEHQYTERAYTETTLGVYKIKERIYNKRTWVVLLHNVLSGTISLIPADYTLYIKSVAVAPTAQGKGLGKQMMKLAEQEALKRGLRYLELTTTHFLIEAISLYERFGFEKRGQKDLYGTPLIRMIKDLKQHSAPIDQKKNNYNKHLISNEQ